MKVLVLNPFTIDPLEHSNQHSIEFLDESLTVQADVEASDINTIVRVFGVTQELPYGSLTPFYDDITDFPTDFHTAQNIIATANEAFMLLPSEQRSNFNNDPGAFLDFVNDPSNYDKAVQLGFIPPKDTPTPPANGLPDSKDLKTPPTAPPGVNDAAHSST